MTRVVRETDFPTLKLLQRGKVRDMYDLGDAYLMVATDRMSAFDVVMPDLPSLGDQTQCEWRATLNVPP